MSQGCPQKSKKRELLRSLIARRLAISDFDQKDFLPAGELDSLITEQSVRAAIGSDGAELSVQLLQYILGPARTLFAILCMTLQPDDLMEVLQLFQHKDISDANLPVDLQHANDGGVFHGIFDDDPWDLWTKHAFINVNQWIFLAPVFSKPPCIVQLNPKHILPFKYKDKIVKSGAFGDVVQVTIHERHYDSGVTTFDQRLANIAVKEMKQDGAHDESEWQRELQAHIMFDTYDHPNIIKFFGAITRDNKRYLLCQWADGGNLRELWQSHRDPALASMLVKDLVMQLHGLAEAIAMLHGRGEGGNTSSYRHGDIKPENVLRMRSKHVDNPLIDVGILKIADMGLAKHHTVATELRRNSTSMKFTTWRYEPPEVEFDDKQNTGRSTRQDIWSFGCVILELLVWLLHGSDALDIFNDQWVVYHTHQGRAKAECPYYEIDNSTPNKSARVHVNVTATMDALAFDHECKGSRESALRDLLRLVKERLLVVNLNGEAQRAKASEVQSELARMLAKGNKDGSYWCSGTDRSSTPMLKINRADGSGFLDVPGFSRGAHTTRSAARPPTPPIDSMNVLSFEVPNPSLMVQSRKDVRNSTKTMQSR